MTTAPAPSSAARIAHAAFPAPQVTVRYWAAARAAAERREDVVSGRTLAEVLEQVRERHRDRPRLAAVLAISSLLVGDQPTGTGDPALVGLAEGDVVEVLPPFAGG